MILGLTGSYGSGKSTVAEMMKTLGAVIIDADDIAREVVQPGQPALQEIEKAFGNQILQPDGHLDRPALARLVFHSPEKRRLLESIIHPRIRERELALLHHYRHHPLVVLNVPLLFENRMESLCDFTCVVTVNQNERHKRLRHRDGVTHQQIRQRLQAQMPQKEKAKRADFIINNSHSLDDTRRQVETIIDSILKKRGRISHGSPE